MEILLDTCTLIWMIQGSKQVPKEIKKLIIDENNDVYASVASELEVEIKHLKNPNLMPIDAAVIENEMAIVGIPVMPLRINYLIELKNIVNQNIHKDPFDHLLLAMAKFEKMTLITHNANMAKYDGVKVINY